MSSGNRKDSNTDQFARIGEKNFFMNPTYIMSRKWESNVFGLRRPNDSNTAVFARSGEKKFLMNSTYIISRKWESNVFGLRRPK